MARGIIGKALRGVAAVAVPAAFEAQKAEILRLRDERLQSYQTSERKAEQQFRATERIAGQQHDRQMQEDRLKIEAPQRELALQLAEQKLLQGDLELAEQERIQGLQNTILSPDASEEERNQAVTTLNTLLGKDTANEWELRTTERGDTSGYEQDIIAVNPRTLQGRRVQILGEPSREGGTDSSEYSEEEINQVLEANPGGTREQAIRYLRQIMPR